MSTHTTPPWDNKKEPEHDITPRLRLQDSETKIHYGLWYCDIVKIIMDEEKKRIAVEHSTGKLFIDGLNLEQLFTELHQESVEHLHLSKPPLAVQEKDTAAIKIETITWEAPEEEE